MDERIYELEQRLNKQKAEFDETAEHLRTKSRGLQNTTTELLARYRKEIRLDNQDGSDR